MGIMSDLSLSIFIRKTRKKKQITLAELASATGISYSTLVRLETGDMPQPHPSLLKQVSVGLGMDYISLMELAGYIRGEPLSSASPIRCVQCPFNALPFSSPQEWHITVANTHHEIAPSVLGAKWAITPVAPYIPEQLQIGDILWMDAAIEWSTKAVVVAHHQLIIATRMGSNWIAGNMTLPQDTHPIGRLLGITYATTQDRPLRSVTIAPFATY